MDEAEIKRRLIIFGTEYIQSYTRTIDKNFADTLGTVTDAGLREKYFPIYGRVLGKNCSIAAFLASASLQMFFLDEANVTLRNWKVDTESPQFNQRWTLDTPEHIRKRQAAEQLSISGTPEIDFVSVPATGVLGLPGDDNSYRYIAQDAGQGLANTAGTRAQVDLPNILAKATRTESLRGFAESYEALAVVTETPQVRGIGFEKLWRDVVAFYGWHPKKFGIPGENNDFTAIYGGLHILAEVRWHHEPMNGSQMREFLAKLDPRPRTVGLFISQSGYDNGALKVVRRAVSSKTVVLFNDGDIEAILTDRQDPGPLFLEKLRTVYDLLFEEGC